MSSSLLEQDAFARAAAALVATWRSHKALLAHDDDAPTASRTGGEAQFRNYLLDACGSDHRPLVELLLSAGPLLRERLAAPATDLTWEARRAPLVHQLVATRYLQPDVARWMVDAWGAALEVAPSVVSQPVVTFGGTTNAETGGGFARAVGMVPAQTQAVTGARGRSPAPLPPPSWSGGAAVKRVGAKPLFRTASATAKSSATGASAPHPAMARAMTPRWRTLSPAMNASRVAQLQRMERISMTLVAAATVLVFIAATMALAGRKAATVAVAAVLPLVPVGSSADSVYAAATGPMRPLPPAVSGLESVDSNTTPPPAVARRTVAHGGAQIISTGVAGRYRVSQRAISVSGSPSCGMVADVLARGRTTVEVITHVPGSFTFALASRSVIATLDANAHFEAGPMRGTTDGVSWTFRMRGQFTGDGFTAESNTSTGAILRWGRTQSCVTVAALVAERIPE